MACRPNCGPQTSVTVWCLGKPPVYCDSYKEAEMLVYGSPRMAQRCVMEHGCQPRVSLAGLGEQRRMSMKSSFGYKPYPGRPSRGMPGYAVRCAGDTKPRVFLSWADAMFYVKMMGGKCTVRAARPRDLEGLRRRRAKRSFGCGCGR